MSDSDTSILNAAQDLCWQIERCGSSEDLTKASVLANDLRKRLERYFVGERESRLLHERGIDPNLGKYGCNPLGKCTPPRCPDCPELVLDALNESETRRDPQSEIRDPS